ncbi:hypothetical protein J6590_037515 [Homalodisca vitripennis]|nr:hypothetical protein J6590_037515 [Homalodisca vitripennis]
MPRVHFSTCVVFVYNLETLAGSVIILNHIIHTPYTVPDVETRCRRSGSRHSDLCLSARCGWTAAGMPYCPGTTRCCDTPDLPPRRPRTPPRRPPPAASSRTASSSCDWPCSPRLIRSVNWQESRYHRILLNNRLGDLHLLPARGLPHQAATGLAARDLSESSSTTASETSTCCQLEDCPIKLRLALQPETYQVKSSSTTTSETPTCYQLEDRLIKLSVNWQESRYHRILLNNRLGDLHLLPARELPHQAATGLAARDLSESSSTIASETSTCCQLEDCLIKLRLALQPETYQRVDIIESSSTTASETSTCCQLEDSLIKLRLALQPETYQENFQESIFPIERGSVESSHCYDHDHDDSDSQYEEDHRLPLLGQYPKVYSFTSSEHPFLPLPELQLNPLSERVLQWLDLSGKGKRLSAAPPREAETSREPKTADPRRTLRRRELPTRSLSVDVLANIKLSARSLNTHVRQKKQHPVIVTSPTSSEHEECRTKKPPEEPPVVQTFEPPRLLRPLSSWPQSATPNRPQLHIFMPPLADEVRLEDTSECESTNEGT